MSEPKTKRNDGDVAAYLNTVTPEQKKKDSFALVKIFEEVTGEPAEMWGPSIVGFGSYHYKYASGREGDWMLAGFAPRKQQLTLYIMDGFEHYDDLLSRLGKHSTGKSCLYIKSLEDVDEAVLREMIAKSVDHMRKTNPPAG